MRQEARLKEALRLMKECKDEVAAAEVEFGLRETAGADQINTSMMDILHMWCRSAPPSPLAPAPRRQPAVGKESAGRGSGTGPA